MQDALGSNPNTHKAEDSPKAAVGTFPYPHRPVAEIDAIHRIGLHRASQAIIPAGSHQAGAGEAAHLARANNLKPISHE